NHVRMGQNRIRVFNVHLNNRITPDERRDQLRPVAARAARHPGPSIVAGDFNTTPVSWLLRVVPIPTRDQTAYIDGLMREHGFDTPTATARATSKWLAMRLDAVYTRELLVQQHDVEHDVSVSDHFPMWIDLWLAEAGDDPPQ